MGYGEADVFVCSAVTTLSLRGCQSGNARLGLLLRSCSHVTDLDLGRMRLDKGAIKTICRALTDKVPQLRKLDLSG